MSTEPAAPHELVIPTQNFGALVATPHAGPLVRLAVRRKLKARLSEIKVKNARTGKATTLSVTQQDELYALVGDDAIDAAYREAVESSQTQVGGPLIDWFKNNPELIAKIVEIILAVLLGG